MNIVVRLEETLVYLLDSFVVLPVGEVNGKDFLTYAGSKYIHFAQKIFLILFVFHIGVNE
tara:strand:+ start:456 stop:635 length:180 start_codon:yes stop_codon:yes gene_type:complete